MYICSMRCSIPLLRDLCYIHAPSGHEQPIKDFLISYIQTHSSAWKTKPLIISGKDFQDNIVLVFGQPRTAIFCHMDSVGFSVSYQNQLLQIGGSVSENGMRISGADSNGSITCSILIDAEHGMLKADSQRLIELGTTLVYEPHWREYEDYIECSSLDNRLGVWVALQLAETLSDGIIVFSTWEEHGGGSVGYLAKFIYDNYQIKQALICDITWVTEGVAHGKGVVISIRDRYIPRKSYIKRIIDLAQKSGIIFQLEVEDTGSSDGGYLQHAPYPIDWCFVGAPESNMHSPHEKVHKNDILQMIDLYKYLMKEM